MSDYSEYEEDSNEVYHDICDHAKRVIADDLETRIPPEKRELAILTIVVGLLTDFALAGRFIKHSDGNKLVGRLMQSITYTIEEVAEEGRKTNGDNT